LINFSTLYHVQKKDRTRTGDYEKGRIRAAKIIAPHSFSKHILTNKEGSMRATPLHKMMQANFAFYWKTLWFWDALQLTERCCHLHDTSTACSWKYQNMLETET